MQPDEAEAVREANRLESQLGGAGRACGARLRDGIDRLHPDVLISRGGRDFRLERSPCHAEPETAVDGAERLELVEDCKVGGGRVVGVERPRVGAEGDWPAPRVAAGVTVGTSSAVGDARALVRRGVGLSEDEQPCSRR